VRDRLLNYQTKGHITARLLIDTKTGEANDRDAEWRDALSKEFKIGGALMTHDDKWVREKVTNPERWARIVRLAITPRDVKLHDYQLDERKLDLSPRSIIDLSKPEK
jgi:hypothetical protein